MKRQVILILALVGALLAVPAVAQAHPALEPRIEALEAAVADLQGQVGALETRTTYSKAQSFSAAAGFSSHTLSCNSGDEATGGGFRDSSQSSSVQIEYDAPAQPNSSNPTGWTVWVENSTGGSQTIEVHVVCLDL